MARSRWSCTPRASSRSRAARSCGWPTDAGRRGATRPSHPRCRPDDRRRFPSDIRGNAMQLSVPAPMGPRRSRRPHRSLLALALIALLPATAAAQDGSLASEQIAERLRIVERRLGLAPAEGAAGDLAELDRRLRAVELGLDERDRRDAPAATPAPEARAQPTITLAADKGASIRSADGQVQLKLGALVQADHRLFIDDDQRPQNDGFLWRRIRPTLEGSWGELVGFRITPEFAG